MNQTGKKWPRRHRALSVVVVVVVLAAVGGGIWWAASSSSAAPLVTTTTTVQTVATGTITKTVSSSGTIEPASQADLDFAASGTVDAVDVTTGQTVTAGQALATIGSAALSAALAQAQAALANDQAQLASDQDDGASAASIASDSASVASAQLAVDSAQTSLDDATLSSPIAGTVAAVDLTVGQQVTASGGGGSTDDSASTGSTGSGLGSAAAATGSSTSSTSATTAQVVVVSTGSYVVDASVDSTDVGQVKVGDQAVITPSGATTPVYGTVGSVGLLASTSTGVATFPVVVDVTGSPTGLYGGSSATMTITTEELQDVVVVPTAAISYAGNDTTVEVDVNGSKQSRAVQIGAASDGDTQVTSGLSVGDKIYVTEISFRGGTGTSRSSLFGGTGGAGFTRGGRGFEGGGGFGG